MNKWALGGLPLALLLCLGTVQSAPLPIRQRAALLKTNEAIRAEIVQNLGFGTGLQFCSIPPQTSAGAINASRSLFVHDVATLGGADFSLKRTLGQIADQATSAGAIASAESIFQELWDTQNPGPGLNLGPHCDDDSQTINGFPVSCRPGEGGEATTSPLPIDKYAPVALVNRLDLAHQGWRNCGEHRIVYGRQGGGRNFIIFEAVLPNPRPGCREACLPVARFWADLSDDARFFTDPAKPYSDPKNRAAALEEFFYNGLPGFRPVVHVDHYSATGVSTSYGSSGSGQIRTNQFIQGPWLLKEFKTVIDCGPTPCELDIVPIPVKVNPFGELWDASFADPGAPGPSPSPRTAAFEADVINSLAQLSSTTLTGIGYPVDLDHNAAESASQAGTPPDHYRLVLNRTGNTFKTDIAANLASPSPPISLTTDQIANRAIAVSCAGCHQPGTFQIGSGSPNALGPAALPGGAANSVFPDSAGFVHVTETATNLPELTGTAFGPSGGQNPGFRLSPALMGPAALGPFLEERRTFLVGQLNANRCACRPTFRVPRPPRPGFPRPLPVFPRPFPIPPLPGPRITALQAKEVEVLRRFQPEVDRLTRAATPGGRKFHPSVMISNQRQLAATLAARDRAIDELLVSAGFPPASVALRPQTINLNAAKRAPNDERLQAQLRAQEVRAIDKREPPRRTVTGSFRVH